MTKRRDKAFIPVSYLKGLLAGDSHCEWASWFKANFQDFPKMPSDFDFDQLNVDHSNLLNKVMKVCEKYYEIWKSR